MKKYISVFIILLISFVFAACTPKTDDPDLGWRTYQNDALGISFDLPDTWVTEEGDGVITIAVNQDALDNEIINGAGASITVATAKDFDGFSDPAGILALFIDYFKSGRSDLELISEPETITIQNQAASTVSYKGTVQEQTGVFVATIISKEDNIALILTIDGSESEEYQNTLERITQSISIHNLVK